MVKRFQYTSSCQKNRALLCRAPRLIQIIHLNRRCVLSVGSDSGTAVLASFFLLLLFRGSVMFCGGSFRSKTIEENDEYRLVKVNDTEIKILRSASLNQADRPSGRKIFAVSPRVPGNGAKRVSFKQPQVSKPHLSYELSPHSCKRSTCCLHVKKRVYLLN